MKWKFVYNVYSTGILANYTPVRFLLPVCRLSWFLYTLNIYAHFSSHFSQQLLMAEIWYLVTNLHIGVPYCGKRFWTHQIPTSCLPTLLIFIHIEHICSFFVTFFSATIDGRNLIFGHKFHIGTPYRGKWRGYHKWALANRSSWLYSLFLQVILLSFKLIV